MIRMQQLAIAAGSLALGFALGRLPMSTCDQQRPTDTTVQAISPPEVPATPSAVLVDAEPARARELVVESPPLVTEPLAPPPHDLGVKEAMAILAKAMKDHPTVNGDDQVFADKYRDMSLEQIMAARVVLDHQFQEEMKRIVAERMKQGLYEEAMQGDGKQLSLTNASGSNIAFGGFTQNTDGVSKMTTIPTNEYPAFDDLQREWSWLENKLDGRVFAHMVTGNH